MSMHPSLQTRPKTERSKQHPGQARASARKRAIRAQGDAARKTFAGWAQLPWDDRCYMQSADNRSFENTYGHSNRIYAA